MGLKEGKADKLLQTFLRKEQLTSLVSVLSVLNL